MYAYAVPLEDTEEEYPNDRVVYLKLTSSITGWTIGESLPTFNDLDEDLDDWESDAWYRILTYGPMHKYWPCQNAIAQVSILPNSPVPDEGTKASLNLSTVTDHINTVIRARVAGAHANDYSIAFEPAATAGFDPAGPAAVYKGCDSHADQAAARTALRSGRSVRSIASPQRSLVASARR